ncbi:unnamed protein product [Durusdinium trenchii]|uniref:Uncharacterized protein n=1 Tax=Durusdinium trenchii TaxID=1381693 RepID=A0ABP0IR19_9DINO
MLIDAQRQIRPGDQAGSCFHALGPNWWDQIYHQPAGHDLPLHQRPKRIAEAGNGDVLPQLKKLRLSEGEDGDMLATGLRYVSPGSRGSRMLDTVVAHYVLVGYVSECEVDTEDSVVFVENFWKGPRTQRLSSICVVTLSKCFRHSYGPSGGRNWQSQAEATDRSASQDSKPSDEGSRGDASQERRARIQQRAWDEMQRYRQALRNCEAGLAIRHCA